VTFVVPGKSRTSVKPLENVVVLIWALFHCHSKEELLHVCRAEAHEDAYSCPVPVVSAGSVAALCDVVVDLNVDVGFLLTPRPDAT
jgi:hypothetical protein